MCRTIGRLLKDSPLIQGCGINSIACRRNCQRPEDLSPRLGFAWSPAGNWAVRGGSGIFVDRYLLSTVNRIEQFDKTNALQQIAEGARPPRSTRRTLFSSPHTGIAPNTWTAQLGLGNPYSETARSASSALSPRNGRQKRSTDTSAESRWGVP